MVELNEPQESSEKPRIVNRTAIIPLVKRDNAEYIFVARKASRSFTATGWELPGGSVEPGETVEENVKKELLEETGLEGEKLGIQHIIKVQSPSLSPEGILVINHLTGGKGTAIDLNVYPYIALLKTESLDLPPLSEEHTDHMLLEWPKDKSLQIKAISELKYGIVNISYTQEGFNYRFEFDKPAGGTYFFSDVTAKVFSLEGIDEAINDALDNSTI